MTYIPYAPELGAKYILQGPDGTIAAFNDPTNANNVGALSEITGLDSASVIDSSGDLVEADGGYVGNQWYGRRPITMTATMYGYSTVGQRNAQMAKIRRASNCMKADGLLYWTTTDPANPLTLYTVVRRQQPTRFDGGWIKTANISLISYLAPILSTPAISAGGTTSSVTVENRGDYLQGFIDYLTITGPATGPLVITNTTTGEVIQFLVGLNVASGATMYVYNNQHSAVTGTTLNNDHIDYLNSTWLTMAPGFNTYTVNSGKIGILYNHAWV